MFVGKWFSVICAALAVGGTPLMGNWSTPPEVVYPASPPDNATNPFIATDGNGNCVAVWFDESGSGSMQAATLASGAVNGQGQPLWVLTDSIVSSNVESPANPYAQAVGMDASGNAIAVFTDGTLVYVSTLTWGSTTWATPSSINTPIGGQTVTNPYIGVAANGNAVVTWYSSIHPYDGHILASVFSSGSWGSQVTLVGGSNKEFHQVANPVAMDPLGNALVAFTSTSNGIQAFSYNVDSQAWTPIYSVATDPVATSCAMDASGNAVIVWIENDFSAYAASLPANQSALSGKVQLSSNADYSVSNPIVRITPGGTGMAVWTDGSGSLASARYANNNWVVLSLMDLSGQVAHNISASIDINGNGVASWTISLGSTSFIQTSSLSIGSSSWQTPVLLSPSSDVGDNSQIILAGKNGIAIWENDSNSGVGMINSSNFLNIAFFASPTPGTSSTSSSTLSGLCSGIKASHPGVSL